MIKKITIRNIFSLTVKKFYIPVECVSVCGVTVFTCTESKIRAESNHVL